tara:strand:- start:602 stop:1186 length:585 start_codon:yes stop_codon:yes gene_type:complete
MEDGELKTLLGIKYQQPLMRWAFGKTNKALRLSRDGPPTPGIGKPLSGSHQGFTFVSENYIWEAQASSKTILLVAKVQKHDSVFTIITPDNYNKMARVIVQGAPTMFEGASSWFMVREGFTNTVNGCFRYGNLILCCLVPHNLVPACEAITRSMGRFIDVAIEDLIPVNLIAKLPKAPQNVFRMSEHIDRESNK